MSAVKHLDAVQFDQEVLTSAAPVLVDFYADWCPPCRLLAPVLDRFASTAPETKIVKVNIDDSPEIAARYGIGSIPTLLVFQNGQVVRRRSGLANQSQLEQLVGA